MHQHSKEWRKERQGDMLIQKFLDAIDQSDKDAQRRIFAQIHVDYGETLEKLLYETVVTYFAEEEHESLAAIPPLEK